MLKLFTYDDPETPVFTYRGNDWVKGVAAARKAKVSFEELELEHMVLRNVDFSGLNLFRCNFYGSDLSGADFTGAELQDASFIRTYCVRAKFVRADLDGATFAAAVCDSADFTGANLRDAVFVGTVLHRAELTDAALAGAAMQEALLAHLASPLVRGQFSAAQLAHYRDALCALLYRIPTVAPVLAQELRNLGADSPLWNQARHCTAEHIATAIRRAARGDLRTPQEVLVYTLDTAPLALDWLYSISGDPVKAELTSEWISAWRTHMRTTIAAFLHDGKVVQEPRTQVHARKLRLHRKE